MLLKDKFIDVHTHKAGENDTISVVNLFHDRTEPIVKGKFYSVGIHPWYIPEKGSGKVLKELDELARKEEVVAIGECGLDKHSETPVDLQQYIFEKQVEIADKYHKPIIIHCVRSFNELVQVKLHSRSEVEWIVHGFNSNLHIADMLIRHEMKFSFGKALMKPNSNASKVLPQLEDELYLLETDDGKQTITDIYQKAAALVGMDLDTMKLSMVTNFINIFKI